MLDDARFVTKGDFNRFRGEVAERDGRLATELSGIHTAVKSLAKQFDQSGLLRAGSLPPMRPKLESVSELEEEITAHGHTRTGRLVARTGPEMSVPLSTGAHEVVESIVRARTEREVAEQINAEREKMIALVKKAAMWDALIGTVKAPIIWVTGNAAKVLIAVTMGGAAVVGAVAGKDVVAWFARLFGKGTP
jgi:hypothetical protein